MALGADRLCGDGHHRRRRGFRRNCALEGLPRDAAEDCRECKGERGMGTQPDEIVSRIDRQRDRLGENLQELETRLRDATDWRVQYKRHPWIMLGAVFGGGMLLARVLLGGGGSSSNGSGSSGKPAGTQISEALRGAIITLAVNKLRDYVSAQMPAPQQH